MKYQSIDYCDQLVIKRLNLIKMELVSHVIDAIYEEDLADYLVVFM